MICRFQQEKMKNRATGEYQYGVVRRVAELLNER